MKTTEAKQILEALFFASAAPIKLEKIKLVMEIDAKTTGLLIAELNQEYAQNNHSIHIREVAGGWQMFTQPQFSVWIKKLFSFNQESKLSSAALETLAVIAYKQPLTRLEIEDIRGVSVGHILKSLLEKKLIMVAGRKQEAGRPMLYRTTTFFLSYFGLKDLTELPQPKEFQDLLNPASTESPGKDQESKNEELEIS